MHRIRSPVIVFFLLVVLLFHLDSILSFLHSGGISSVAGLIMTSRNSARCAKKKISFYRNRFSSLFTAIVLVAVMSIMWL